MSTGFVWGDWQSLYFLDEPTSGLDSAAASEIMRVITQMARTRNVVSHRPPPQMDDYTII
jgi:ABC-type multidrug transport system ATPase subunit